MKILVVVQHKYTCSFLAQRDLQLIYEDMEIIPFYPPLNEQHSVFYRPVGRGLLLWNKIPQSQQPVAVLWQQGTCCFYSKCLYLMWPHLYWPRIVAVLWGPRRQSVIFTSKLVQWLVAAIAARMWIHPSLQKLQPEISAERSILTESCPMTSFYCYLLSISTCFPPLVYFEMTTP